jgi:murein DD-endopeptidase MepM/ murein hydrolase activator NlpD
MRLCSALVVGLELLALNALAVPLQDPTPALSVSALVAYPPDGQLHPGSVALIVVRSSRPVNRVAAEAFDRAVAFWPTGDAREWRAFLGVGLDVRPGLYEIVVNVNEGPASAVTHRMPLTVAAKTFETRRLSVPDRFVNPPASLAERIAREARLLADTFSRVRVERLWRGPFDAPVGGGATSSFGRLTILNGKPGGRHQGADFRAAEGTPVKAPNSGLVVLAGDLYYSGNTVVVDHGYGLFSLLAHLSRMAVTVGSPVARGEVVGESGSTGRVTGPHLHWAVRLGPLSVDPLSLVSAAAAEEADPATP